MCVTALILDALRQTDDLEAKLKLCLGHRTAALQRLLSIAIRQPTYAASALLSFINPRTVVV